MTQLTSEWAAPIERRGTSGEAVILIHGFTGHPGHWIPTADFLSERGHTVVAPRLAGHGTTPEDLATTTVEDWLRSGRESVEAVAGSHRRIHLVGLSMGGLIAILLAEPTAASTITTINTPIVTRETKALLAPLAQHWMESTPAQFVTCPDPALDYLWSPYTVNPTAAVAELVRAVGLAWVAAGRLRRPSLVVQSRTDEIVRPVSARILARRLDARLLWLEQARHNAILDPARSLIQDAIVGQVERSP